MTNTGWISVHDRLPETDYPVLVRRQWMVDRGETIIGYCWRTTYDKADRDRERGKWYVDAPSGDPLEQSNVEAWQPLPVYRDEE
jgi:hypothetical protein